MLLQTNTMIRIGEVWGHRIFLDLIAFGIFALFVLSGGDESLAWPVSFLVAAFFSVLIHELGHAVAVKKLTGQSTVIVIGFAGGYTMFNRVYEPKKDLAISLAGPGAGFLLGGIGWIVALLASPQHLGWPPWNFYVGDSIWLMALYFTVLISTLWGALNLLPVYPLDGGQALRSILVLARMAPLKARQITRRLAVGAAALVAVLALQGELNQFFLYIAIWVFFANWQEAQREGW